MEFINPIAAIIALIVAIFSIPKTLHSINEHRRKKFRDELENYKEYFEKFYNCDPNNYPKLLRDKAAQNLTRSHDIDAGLLNHLIELHEKNLVNFDKITDQYYWGSRFIDTYKAQSSFTFKSKRRLSRTMSLINYALYAIFLTIAVFTFLGKINLFNVQWFDSLMGTVHIILAISSLRTADDMKEALKFLATIKNAETQHSSTEILVQHDNQVDMAS
ncbi:hypothetical protein [Acinetobacter terrae]|jgi:hypothetical protein|uniref:hypothetical protein n=1 Tax=Acinetobacter terrae TaxID=2731247 RepID=UPI001BC88C71|nr:hypothetical protein [Acinetobacter terrae]